MARGLLSREWRLGVIDGSVGQMQLSYTFVAFAVQREMMQEKADVGHHPDRLRRPAVGHLNFTYWAHTRPIPAKPLRELSRFCSLREPDSQTAA